MSNGEVPVTPPEQSYADSALARFEDIRVWREKIPNLVIPETKGARKRLVNAASVPKEFVELATAAVKTKPVLVRSSGQDLAQDKDLSDFADAYGPVADELEALASFVRHSVTLAKNKVGSEALTTYALAQRLSKRPETADLLPHVEDMAKALGKRSRKAKSQPAPTPVPAPAQ
ncbi:MAG TPA: hypothetical protein VF713_08395 [Thermoanaerobaculia bacterium]